jgi:hypothetical protein
VQTLVPRY